MSSMIHLFSHNLAYSKKMVKKKTEKGQFLFTIICQLKLYDGETMKDAQAFSSSPTAKPSGHQLH